jgi:septal ring factor EnvC (AmiA/AmiB activator)
MLTRNFVAALAVALPLAVSACAHNDGRITRADVDRENAEAKHTTQAYVDQKVNDVQRSVRDKIATIDTKIATLRSTSKNESPAVKERINTTIAKLEDKKSRIKARCDELTHAGSEQKADVNDEWVRLGHELDDVTAGLDDAQKDVKSAL